MWIACPDAYALGMEKAGKKNSNNKDWSRKLSVAAA